MPPLPTPEAWVQIRHEYENTRRPIEDICLAHGTSPNTLRRRVKAWGWTMRHPPISGEGPEPVATPPAMPSAKSNNLPDLLPLGPRFRGDEREEAPVDARPIGEQLQGAAARVMRAIETTSARLTAAPISPREMDFAARALGALMRTLRELHELLRQQPGKAGGDDPPPEDMDEFRNELARRLTAVIERHEAEIPAKYAAAWNEFAAEAKRN